MLRSLLGISALALAFCSLDVINARPAVAQASPAPVYGAAGLKEVVAEFKAALEAKDFQAMTSLSMPPALLEHIKKQANVPPDTNLSVMRVVIARGLKTTMDQAKILESSMDDSKSQILTTQTGRKYALVPSYVVMEVQSTKVKSSNNYLALDEGGRWFLVNPSNAASIQAIKAAYPDLATVTLTEPNMEMVSQ